jgi:dihydrolipoamide dehydrogenase
MADEKIRVEALVIGAGPGGYVAGIRLGQLKKKALVVERDKPGGICLNVGCIPSKALINAAKTFDKVRHGADIGILADNLRVDMAKMQAWKGEVVSKLTGGVRSLLKANGCDYRTGTARFVSRSTVEVVEKTGKTIVEAEHIVIATGSRPIEIPGFKFDGNRIVDSTGALDFSSVPERFVVVGGGYIGIEIGTLYAKLGSKVTVVEALPGILAGNDPEIVQLVARKLKKLGVEVLTGAKAKSWAEKDGRAVVTVEVDGKEATVEADKVLVAVGRRPNSEGLGLEEVGVKIERGGFVTVDRQLRTNIPGIYAIGDVVGQPMLAHKASHEAEVVAEVIAGHQAAMDVRCIPAVIFSDPEVATAGLTADEAAKRGRTVKVGKFPFAALGRAIANADTDGFVKVVVDAASKEVLGIQVVGNGASDIIAEAALAIEMGAVAEDLSLTIHAHPTLPEAIMEAAKASLGEAIHIQNR